MVHVVGPRRQHSVEEENVMGSKTLQQIVAEKPFGEYAEWWEMGTIFLNFMSEAVVSEWAALRGNDGSLTTVIAHASEYISTVFGHEARIGLVDDFVEKQRLERIRSGEFDALSYAFYRSAFELMEQHQEQYEHSLARERRLYTKRVGKIFYDQVSNHLGLNLPSALDTPEQFTQLKTGIAAVGNFLCDQGYLRTHFRFTFDVCVEAAGGTIRQREDDVLPNLKNKNLTHALYEMGYAVILPSAVYLYHTVGEAQHHSSRTIEELFERVGYEARETDDFDPINYPADMVVELWEIRAANGRGIFN